MSVLEKTFEILSTACGKIADSLLEKKATLTKARQELFSKKFEAVLMPMDKLLSIFDSSPAHEKFIKLQSIVLDNYNLIPSDIYKELEHLAGIKDIKNEDFNLLKTIVSSHFNHARRTLGYPFDPQKIKFKYTPTSSNSTKAERNSNTFIVVGIITSSALIIVLTHTQAYQHIVGQRIIFALYLFILFACICFFGQKRNI